MNSNPRMQPGLAQAGGSETLATGRTTREVKLGRVGAQGEFPFAKRRPGGYDAPR